jgi:hypothetical protein
MDVMKKKLLNTLLFLGLTLTLSAQYGQNAVGMGAAEYVAIDFPSTTLDVTDGFTFEAWILNFGGASNQKVGGKLVADFKNGFIYGIEDLQVNFEVFDDNGTNTSLKAGTISDIGWTHVAGTYEIGGLLTIYVNGEEVGNTPASSVAINPNVNPFRIGIAPWDVNALGFVGYVDEARYWQTALDGELIKAWMHRDVTPDHPNYEVLSFYHKYNETEGTAAADETENLNFGLLSSEMMVWEDQFLPFAGDADLFENGVQGVWNAKLEGASDIFAITVTLFDTTTLENSVLLSHSDGDYGFVQEAPAGYDRSLSRVWKSATQGGMLVDINFDLGPIDLSAVNEVVMLVSDDGDFSDAEVVSGTLDGNTYSITDYVFTDGSYYTLGFMTNLSSTEATSVDAFDITLAPNPNDGAFNVNINQAKAAPLQLRILSATGTEVWQQRFDASSLINEKIMLHHLPSGVYWLEAIGEEGRSSRKLVIR